MNITKESILEWLDNNRHSRDWLAQKCKVARGTVNNWLVSPRPIPAKAVPIIASLMQADEERDRLETVLPQNLVLEFTRADFDAICDAAIAARKRPNQWAEEQLRDLANENLDELAQQLAAEDPAPYPGKPNADIPEAS